MGINTWRQYVNTMFSKEVRTDFKKIACCVDRVVDHVGFKQHRKIEKLEKQLEDAHNSIHNTKVQLEFTVRTLWLLDEHEEAQSALRKLGVWGTVKTQELREG